MIHVTDAEFYVFSFYLRNVKIKKVKSLLIMYEKSYDGDVCKLTYQSINYQKIQINPSYFYQLSII